MWQARGKLSKQPSHAPVASTAAIVLSLSKLIGRPALKNTHHHCPTRPQTQVELKAVDPNKIAPIKEHNLVRYEKFVQKLICLRKSGISVERISSCNELEKLAEHR